MGGCSPETIPPSLGLAPACKIQCNTASYPIKIEPRLVAKWACFIVTNMKKYFLFTAAFQTVWNLTIGYWLFSCLVTDISKNICIQQESYYIRWNKAINLFSITQNILVKWGVFSLAKMEDKYVVQIVNQDRSFLH